MAFKLSTGLLIPSIGLGTWQGSFAQEVLDCTADVVKNAIKAGYRHIDAASCYGNQKQIGTALRECFEDGLVKREDLWITSKLWCNDHDRVAEALEQTLNDLQLDYLDLYLVHWPVRMKGDADKFDFRSENFLPLQLKETWSEMEKLVDSSKVRAIGVSNFSSKKLDQLLVHARIVPAVNQVECHPSWQQKHLHEYCTAKGIHLSAFSPLGKSKDSVLNSSLVCELAAKLGRSPAQVALRWGLECGHSVLPKSSNLERLKENLNICNWSIPAEDLDKFSKLEQVRLVDFCDNADSYAALQGLWDDA